MNKILSIKRTTGVAGQYAYDVTVQYDNESPSVVGFVGNVYGGPIVMMAASGAQTFVTNPERFGPRLSPSWVRAFFARS